MLTAWRNDGIDRTQLEVWVVGPQTDATTVESFADGSEAACFIDPTSSVVQRYDATKDDLLLIDGEQTIRRWMNLAQDPLSTAANQTRLDGWVRELF